MTGPGRRHDNRRPGDYRRTLPRIRIAIHRLRAALGVGRVRFNPPFRPASGRVGEDVTTLTPHRSGRAGFPLPVPRGRVSLTVAVDDHSYRSSIKYRPPALPGRGAFVPSRQSGYPLSFRVQVCRVHAPSRVSRQWFSPRDASLSSFGSRRARFPALSGTMKALRLPICVSMVTYGFASTAHAILLFSCSAVALPKVGGLFRARALVSPATHFPACSRVDANGTSQVFRRSFPCLCSAPRPRSNRRTLAISVTSMLPPLSARRRLRQWLISGLTHAASAPADLRFAFCVATHAQGSLPAGWLAFTGRASNPLDRDERFQFV